MPKGKQPFTPERADYYVTELRGMATKLAEIGRQMREEGAKELAVMSQPTADIGLVYFHRLIQSCEREVKHYKLQKLKP
jgi:hypothetical protein